MRDEHAGIPGVTARNGCPAGPGHHTEVAAGAVVDDVGAVRNCVLESHDDLGIERAAGVLTGGRVENAIAEDLGLGRHAGDRFHQTGDVGFRVGVAGGGAHGVAAVAAASRAGPHAFIPGRRRIPGPEVGPRTDDLLGGVAGVAHRVAGWIFVAGGVEEGIGGIDAGVNTGDNYALARHILAAQLGPHSRRVNERQAGVHVQLVLVVTEHLLDAVHLRQYVQRLGRSFGQGDNDTVESHLVSQIMRHAALIHVSGYAGAGQGLSQLGLECLLLALQVPDIGAAGRGVHVQSVSARGLDSCGGIALHTACVRGQRSVLELNDEPLNLRFGSMGRSVSARKYVHWRRGLIGFVR